MKISKRKDTPQETRKFYYQELRRKIRTENEQNKFTLRSEKILEQYQEKLKSFNLVIREGNAVIPETLDVYGRKTYDKKNKNQDLLTLFKENSIVDRYFESNLNQLQFCKDSELDLTNSLMSKYEKIKNPEVSEIQKFLEENIVTDNHQNTISVNEKVKRILESTSPNIGPDFNKELEAQKEITQTITQRLNITGPIKPRNEKIYAVKYFVLAFFVFSLITLVVLAILFVTEVIGN